MEEKNGRLFCYRDDDGGRSEAITYLSSFPEGEGPFECPYLRVFHQEVIVLKEEGGPPSYYPEGSLGCIDPMRKGVSLKCKFWSDVRLNAKGNFVMTCMGITHPLEVEVKFGATSRGQRE